MENNNNNLIDNNLNSLNNKEDIFTYKILNKTNKLKSIDNNLITLILEVYKISPIKFIITEGLRTKERQTELLKNKKTKTLNSKHLIGKAIDFCPIINNKLNFEAINDLMFLNGIFYIKAKELKINVRLGCLWNNSSIKENSFVDGYHVEIIN